MSLLTALLSLLLLTCSASSRLSSDTLIKQQQPFQKALSRPWGTNNATYGPVPEAEQLFGIEWLEIAPSPMLVDHVVFVWLRGYIRPTRPGAPDAVTDDDLSEATLKLSSSAVYPDGEVEDPMSITIPLEATVFNMYTHLSIRNESGAYVDYLTTAGANDILLDWGLLMGDYMHAGDWTFDVAAELPDGRTLFALSLTQYLNGKL